MTSRALQSPKWHLIDISTQPNSGLLKHGSRMAKKVQ